jgi:hypothetical protein
MELFSTPPSNAGKKILQTYVWYGNYKPEKSQADVDILQMVGKGTLKIHFCITWSSEPMKNLKKPSARSSFVNFLSKYLKIYLMRQSL